MNLLSPIGWALHFNFNNRVKNLVKLLSFIAARCLSNEQAASYSAIFYASVYQLIRLGIIELEEFLNPTSQGPDIACELFQQTLNMKFLPQFAPSRSLPFYWYSQPVSSLEYYMNDLFGEEPKPDENSLRDAWMFEVRYGLIDLDWPSLLFTFNQKPANAVFSHYLLTAKTKNPPVDARSVILAMQKQLDLTKFPPMTSLLAQPKQEIFTFKSI